MSLLYIDGFDLQDWAARWTYTHFSVGNVTTDDGRFGGSAVVASSSSYAGAVLSRSVPASAKVTVGFAMTQVNTSAGSVVIFEFATDSGASPQVGLVLLSTGELSVVRGSNFGAGEFSVSGTTLGTTSGAGLNDDGWHYLEVQAVVDSSVGSVLVKADGKEILNLTGVNTKNAGTSSNIDQIALGANGNENGTITVTFDDLYVLNDQGSTNNDFLGSVRVQTLLPTSAGSKTDFTPNGLANNWQNASQVPANASDYNSADTVGQRDTYTMGDLAASTSNVFGVQQVLNALASDAGATALKAAQLSGPTLSYGTTHNLTATASAYLDLFESNPATSAAYTVPDVNALEAGAEVA